LAAGRDLELELLLLLPPGMAAPMAADAFVAPPGEETEGRRDFVDLSDDVMGAGEPEGDRRVELMAMGRTADDEVMAGFVGLNASKERQGTHTRQQIESWSGIETSL
jgi:hypothetical protein